MNPSRFTKPRKRDANLIAILVLTVLTILGRSLFMERPELERATDQIMNDKVIHFLVSGILALIFGILWSRTASHSAAGAALRGIGCTVFVGFVVEVLESWIRSESFEGWDLLADTLGALCFGVLLLLLTNPNSKDPSIGKQKTNEEHVMSHPRRTVPRERHRAR